MDSGDAFKKTIASAQQGDRDAIAALWRAHQPALIAWLRTFDVLLAEEVSSDAWIDVLRGLDRFDGDEKHFRSWLFTIARRRLIDRQRRDTRRSDLVTQLVPIQPAADASTEALDSIASDEAIQQIVRILPPVQAEIVLLRVVGGLDTNHVAKVIGKKPGAVRVLQHRALRTLAKSLGAADSTKFPREAEEV